MHEMLTIVINAYGVCLSVMWLKSAAAARAVYTACHVHGVIWFSLHQMQALASC